MEWRRLFTVAEIVPDECTGARDGDGLDDGAEAKQETAVLRTAAELGENRNDGIRGSGRDGSSSRGSAGRSSVTGGSRCIGHRIHLPAHH